MKQIYIILTYTGTVLSKIIKVYTRKEFSHVSISLDKQLKQMYSFGRLNAYNPFIGGFVHEGLEIGTFKRFYKTKTAIYSMIISDEQYNKMIKTVNNIKNTSKDYKFNLLGLFAAAFHIRIQMKSSFYCAEFVKYLMDNANINNNLPSIVRPEDFKKLDNIKLEYKGVLKDYEKYENLIKTMIS